MRIISCIPAEGSELQVTDHLEWNNSCFTASSEETGVQSEIRDAEAVRGFRYTHKSEYCISQMQAGQAKIEAKCKNKKRVVQHAGCLAAADTETLLLTNSPSYLQACS